MKDMTRTPVDEQGIIFITKDSKVTTPEQFRTIKA